MKKLLVLLLFITLIFSCDYKTESSMDSVEMANIKDPCLFIDEFQKSINDWVYFKEKGGPSSDSENLSFGRVSDNIFAFNSFFHRDEEYDEDTFNSQEFTRSDFQDCENFKSTKEAFLEHFGYIWGSGEE